MNSTGPSPNLFKGSVTKSWSLPIRTESCLRESEANVHARMGYVFLTDKTLMYHSLTILQIGETIKGRYRRWHSSFLFCDLHASHAIVYLETTSKTERETGNWPDTQGKICTRRQQFFVMTKIREPTPDGELRRHESSITAPNWFPSLLVTVCSVLGRQESSRTSSWAHVACLIGKRTGLKYSRVSTRQEWHDRIRSRKSSSSTPCVVAATLPQVSFFS